MARIKVKRVITIEYDYPFDDFHTGGLSFDEMKQDEQRGGECGDNSRWACIQDGDFEEEVEFTLVPEITDNMIPSGDIKFNGVETLRYLWELAGDNPHQDWGRAISDTQEYISSAMSLHGFMVPLQGVREHLLNKARLYDADGYTKVIHLVVEYLNPTEDMGN
jgi:hypothetical protein